MMDTYQRSTSTAILFVVAIFSLLLGRLFWLQVLDFQQLGSVGASASIRRIWELPPRGRMKDRNGKIMIDNRPLYSAKLIPSEFDSSRTAALAWLIKMPESDIAEHIAEGTRYNRFSALTLKRDLSTEDAARLSENIWKLPGVIIAAENKRKYADSLYGAHMFGYLRSISPAQFKELKEEGYARDDKIGFSGLERQYESHLRGIKGTRFVMVTPLGRNAGRYDEGRSDIPAIRGNDLSLSIDMELQKLAGKLLAETGKSGAVVAIDPRTGGILALQSAPDFNLEVFNGATDPAGWENIRSDPQKPLFNRTVQAVYPPGSIYKMVLATAALEEKTIDPDKKVLDNGVFRFGNRQYLSHRGEGHGMVDMREAIAVSSNVYFYSLIFDVGFTAWTNYGALFGFGKRTGIDLPGERSGLIPSSDYYNRRYGKGRWTKGNLVSLAIGQGELGTTPIQLATYAAAIANRGTLHQPHIVEGYRDTRTGTYVPFRYRQHRLPLKPETLELIRGSMADVVQTGTGRLAQVPGIAVCGKTGTAQNPHGKDHAWFIAYAPADNPEIALTVLVENAGYGGSVSAPIAGKLIRQYLKHMIPVPSVPVGASTPDTLIEANPLTPAIVPALKDSSISLTVPSPPEKETNDQ